MFSSDENSGTITFLLGLIVLVMSGVGLSMLVDRKFSFSRSNAALNASIKADAEELEQLREILLSESLRLASEEPKQRQLGETRKSLQGSLQETQQQRASLVAKCDNLRQSMPAIEAEFAAYRSKYREQAWIRAVGESLGDLTVKGGREYRKAVITKVTDVGLEIRHENGIARLQAPDLDQAFQDRFQWNDEERRASLKREQDLHDQLSGVKENEKKILPAKKAKAPKNTKPARLPAPELVAARKKVTTWKARVEQLKSDYSQANTAATYGSESSVPGSLETWQSKAARLSADLAKAKGELAAAKAGLAELSPTDPLLRPEVESP